MPIRARTAIRKMRGGAQAHLLEGEDGAYYVAKFTNNPQHRRILINEWLACVFLRYLQIYVPETALVELTPDFVEANPELYFSIGSRRESVKPGLHFGSRMAVNPDRVAVFDFLPDKLLGKVENRADFLGMLGRADRAHGRPRGDEVRRLAATDRRVRHAARRLRAGLVASVIGLGPGSFMNGLAVRGSGLMNDPAFHDRLFISGSCL